MHLIDQFILLNSFCQTYLARKSFCSKKRDAGHPQCIILILKATSREPKYISVIL